MNNYEDNLVSLVTPGWNGKAFVHRLLDSIIAQTYRPIQYIYVDDGSTDGTADVVKGYAQKFVDADIDFLYLHQENAGMCEALMTGFQHVKGLYLSNPEYDDILLPESVEKRVEYLKSHPDCAVVVGDAWVVPENNLDEREKLISHKNPNRFETKHFEHCLRSDTIFNAACYMVRMDRFDETHSDRRIIPYIYGSNQQILLPLYYHWNRGFIDEALSLFVVRQDSISHKDILINQELKQLKEYRDMRIGTINSIKMPEKEASFYVNLIDTFYHNSLLQIGLNNRIWKCFKDGYSFLRKRGEINTGNQLKYKILSIKPIFMFLKWLK